MNESGQNFDSRLKALLDESAVVGTRAEQCFAKYAEAKKAFNTLCFDVERWSKKAFDDVTTKILEAETAFVLANAESAKTSERIVAFFGAEKT